MPFLTLQNTSNLAQYYNNTVNGTFAGTANNPNVTYSPKPEVPESKDQFTLSDEGLIRGGAKNALLAVKKDENRIIDFLKTDKGKLWSVKQLGLQRSNPLLEYSVNYDSPGVSKTKAEITQQTRLYSPLNTLATVGGTAFGLHFDRHGLIPVNTYSYEKIATENSKNQPYQIDFDKSNKNTNRLVSYLSKLINNYWTGTPTTIQSYSSGPNSPYGLGRTRIDTAKTIRTEYYTNSYPVSGSTLKELQQATPVANSPLKDTVLNVQLANSPLLYNNLIAGYDTDIESRIGVSTKKNSDSINMINITDSDTFFSKSEAKKRSSDAIKDTPTDGIYGDDIIKFRIEFLNNNEPVTKTSQTINTNVLAFRAYLDDFSDGMNAKWDAYRYMGRGEEFYVYNGFTRDINVSFTMYAHSPAEMKPLYNKLNYLMSTFAPDYTTGTTDPTTNNIVGGGRMRGNIGYLTVGDYLYRQPGVFTDIKLSGFLDTHWEIALKEDGTIDNTQYEVPKLIKVALSFKPIHTFLPKTGKTIPFITPDSVTYKEYQKTGNKYLG